MENNFAAHAAGGEDDGGLFGAGADLPAMELPTCPADVSALALSISIPFCRDLILLSF